MAYARRVAALIFIVCWCSGLAAQEHRQAGADRPPVEPTVEELQHKVEELTRQLEEVRVQLEALQRQQQATAAQAEADRLRQAAQARVAKVATDSDQVDTTTSFASGTRMQAQLNPELSVTGDLWLVGGNHQHEELQVRGVELDLQSYLDPFTRMHVVIGHHGGGRESTFGHEHEGEEEHEHESAEVEEAYLTWFHLPANLTLTVGKKRQQFGVLNRWHQHALDQVDAPWVLEESFGHHGLSGTGISVDWVAPRLWADANELTVEVTNGDNEQAFAGGDWRHPSFLARLKSYWDLSSGSYFELGLNGLYGSADPDRNLSSRFHAIDFTFNWSPTGRELYRDFTLRGMVVRSERELAAGVEHEALGGYLYGQYKLSRWWTVGARYDRVEDQLEDGHRQWGLSPYLTLWQSEFVRLRAQYSYRDDIHLGIDRLFVLQMTFAAGPHKHETY